MDLNGTQEICQRVGSHEIGIYIKAKTFSVDFVWLKITDEGSVPEMRIWSILLIESDLKW